MKEKKQKKLQLVKKTIDNLDIQLDRFEQGAARGGSDSATYGVTNIPVVCFP